MIYNYMRLYHASTARIREHKLEPRTRNICLADNGLTARFTSYADTNPPYVYATDDLSFAATYAVPKGVRLGNYQGYDNTHILLVEKESIIGEPTLDGGVYAFESDRFVPVLTGTGEKSGQFVSAVPLDLNGAQLIEVTSLNALMNNSVQIYQLADHYSAGDFDRDTEGKSREDFLQKFKELVSTGKIRWLNEEREISPHDSLTMQIVKHEKTGQSFNSPAFKNI